jgi:hypothetical protein
MTTTTFTIKTDAVNHILDAVGPECDRDLAEQVFAALRTSGRISADDAGLHMDGEIDLTAEAARIISSRTVAEQVALEMGEDGSRHNAPDGRSLHAVARAHGAEVYRDEQGERSYRFSDGSAIATSGGAWDVVHEDCTCLWCWAAKPSGAPHCDEQEGEEWRCTLSDDEAHEDEAAAE